MANASLTLGCVDFLDRTRPILERQVEVPGLKVEPVRLKPMELLGRFSQFDVCEVPVFAYMALRSLGEDDYVALPVFPHRGYPQSSVVVHEGAGIRAPKDLAGRRVGTPGLFLSGTVWMRGILQDEYGVGGEGIRWVIPTLPRDSVAWRITEQVVKRSGIQVEEIGPGKNLSEMLEQGEIDAWVGPLPPECFERGARSVRRLFPEYREVERGYASKSRFVPALHAMIMRRRHKEQAGALIELFQRAREAGLKNFHNDNVFAVMLPWMRHHLEELKGLFGDEWVPAGYEPNRALIDAALKYAARQGLTAKQHVPADLFTW
jgi:4,5-dihydroxyphthalate decarboxylase